MVSGLGLVPNPSLELCGLADGMGMAPGLDGDEPNSGLEFLGRIATARIASSSPKEPWLLLKLVGEGGSMSFSPWFKLNDLNKSLVRTTTPMGGAFDCTRLMCRPLDDPSLCESSSDDPSVL
jgi:hypothetical protein